MIRLVAQRRQGRRRLRSTPNTTTTTTTMISTHNHVDMASSLVGAGAGQANATAAHPGKQLPRVQALSRAAVARARIDLHASLPAGPLHPAGPVDPSTGGLPPRALRGQGLSARQQPPARHTLTAPGPRRPGDTGRPGRARTDAYQSREAAVEGDQEVMPPTLTLRDRGG
jgi:hypothetical protein